MAPNDRDPFNPREADKRSRPEQPEKRPRFSIWAFYLVVLVVLFLFQAVLWRGGAGNEVDYSIFLEHLEEGHIEELTVRDNRMVEGLFTEAAIARAGELGIQTQPQTRTFFGEETERAARQFTSVKPEDHDLTEAVQTINAQRQAENLTPVRYSARYESGFLTGLLSWMIPIGLLILLWLFLLRRMGGPGQQVLNIGKSKAALFEPMDGQKLNFKDVAGLDEAKEEVEEVVEFLKNPKKFTRLGGKLPKGVLLVGPPGTGKTLLAKAVAGEADVPFFSLSGSDFVEMFVGVGAARVRDLFKQAKEKAPCIIFIDEIDAIGRTRGRGMVMGGNDERENTLNQLLVEMDGFNTDKGVIIMAATNRPDVLDNALLRPGRFDRQILVDRPDRRERAQIFDVHTRTLKLSDEVDLDMIAGQTPGFAGAEIANVCNEAALLAAREGKEAVEMVDFERSIDRVIGGLEKKNKLISPEERQIVAYHEAGHAVAGWFREYTDPVVKVSIVPRGLAALGYAQSLPEERYLYTREALVDRMVMTMGGRVAEEIVFGRISTGAQNDLERITKLAYAMVVDYGMSESVGYVSYNLSGKSDQPFVDKPYSDETGRMIDVEVRLLIDEVRQETRRLLEEKRDRLEALAQALLSKEVLNEKDLTEVLGPRPYERRTDVRPVDAEGAPANAAAALKSDTATNGEEHERVGGDGAVEAPTTPASPERDGE
ncbi:ATP-dependent zinc metalloprotease FtsH [soil metagenome]